MFKVLVGTPCGTQEGTRHIEISGGPPNILLGAEACFEARCDALRAPFKRHFANSGPPVKNRMAAPEYILPGPPYLPVA